MSMAGREGFGWGVFSRAIEPPDVPLPPSCTADVDLHTPPFAALRDHVRAAAAAYALRRGASAFVAPQLSVSLTHARLERSAAGGCPAALRPHPSEGGLLRAVLLLRGEEQRAHWWQPHASALAERGGRCSGGGAPPGSHDVEVAMVRGSLLLHHAALHCALRPANRSAAPPTEAVWLRFVVWLHAAPPSAGAASAAAASPFDRYTRAWHSPFWLSPPPRAARLLEWRQAHAAMRRLAVRARPRGTPSCGGGGAVRLIARPLKAEEAGGVDSPPFKAEEAGGVDAPPLKAEEAGGVELLREVAEEAARRSCGGGVRGVAAVLRWLPPHHSIGPQASGGRGVRVVLPVGGGVRLYVEDPRPPAVRMAELEGATWPFGYSNRQVAARVPEGGALVLPRGLRYFARAEASEAAWVVWEVEVEGEGGAEEGEGREERGDEGGRERSDEGGGESIETRGDQSVETSGEGWDEESCSESGKEGRERGAESRGERGEGKGEEGREGGAESCSERGEGRGEAGAERDGCQRRSQCGDPSAAPSDGQSARAEGGGAIRVLEVHSSLVYVIRLKEGREARRRAKEVVLRAAREVRSANVSNLGGWQSAPDFLMENDEVRSLLYPQVFEALMHYLALVEAPHTYDLRVTGWANVNYRGHSNALHEHLDQDWALSGVLYLSSGRDPSCSLLFADTRPSSPAGDGPAEGGVAVAAVAAGSVVLFPSSLPHWVPVHCGTAPRVSVAFNVAAGNPSPSPPLPLRFAPRPPPAAAAVAPPRRWPGGEMARADGGVRRHVAAAAAAAARGEAHRLWPLRALLLPLRAAGLAPPPCRACGGGARRRRVPPALLEQIASLPPPSVELLLAPRAGGGARAAVPIVVDACLLDGSVEAHLWPHRDLMVEQLSGVFFPRRTDGVGGMGNCSRRKVVLPDVRALAGQLPRSRRFSEQDGLGLVDSESDEIEVERGSALVYPAWARGFVQPSPACINDEFLAFTIRMEYR
ncbi:hypothetical protein AB1Y20_007796 [Prymnesium parvum]|uniref:JmjC domain-containing protein n=1 Tax=Prymnesium parvum TaxID=97485 RepID=A0AB34ISM6_PRYPA